MKSLARIILLAELMLGIVIAQDTNFSGKVVNNSQQGLEGKKVEVFFNQGSGQIAYHGWTNSQGNFLVNQTSTHVEQENELPDGYTISQNYPNPFNPRTIINISLPKNSIISLDVFTILGEKVFSSDRKEFLAGNNSLAIELNGLSNGVYIARINIDDKFFISRKLLLIYGSQHASELPIPNYKVFEKTVITTTIDSVVITGDAIKRTTFTGFPQYTTNNIALGTFIVDSNYVNINGGLYKLMKWTEPNNGLEGASIQIGNKNMTTGTDGTFNLIIPSGRNDVIISHDNIYQRKTKIIAEKDTTINFDILDKTNFSEDLMANLDTLTGRIIPQIGKTFRWKNVPIFYIQADTNIVEEKEFYEQQKTFIEQHLKPGYIGSKYTEGFIKNAEILVGINPPDFGTEEYHIVKQDTTLPGGGIANTWIYRDNNKCTVYSAVTIYLKGLSPPTMDRITIHELASGMNEVGRTNPYDNILSVFDNGPPIAASRFTEYDYKMLLFLYNRPGGVLRPDTDNGWEGWQ